MEIMDKCSGHSYQECMKKQKYQQCHVLYRKELAQMRHHKLAAVR